jgi:hypothetical protein
MNPTPDRLSADAPEPPVRTRKPHHRLPDEPEAEEDDVLPPRALDADQELPGAVFMVPDPQWGFEAAGSTDHPGACVHYQGGDRNAILVKGTDADHVRNPRRYYVVGPTPENGLDKHTAFELVPRYFRLHKVRLLYPERHLGRLDEYTLHALCEELARLCTEE